MKMKKTIKWGSDFSGVGAADYALKRISEQKGYTIETVYACDWDKYARITYEAAHGLPPYYPKDVYDREIPKDSLDLYVTSPPCQAFSLAGKRLGKDDKRGILFFNSHEFIQENKPRFFIFENVRGLLSDDNGKTFQEWVNMLGGKSVNGVPVLFPYEESVPYHIYWKVLNAKEHGIPQNRERVFIVGIRDDQDNSFTWPKEEPLKLRLKDVLEQEVFEKYFLNEKQVENMQASDFNQERERIQDGDFSGTLLSRDYKAPKCVKVRSNLEKYYLSQKMIDGFMKHNENHEEKGTGFIFSPKDEDDVANCLRANSGINATDNTLKVGFINQNTQASQVFDESGTAPTIPAGTHGYAMSYVQVNDEENVDANDPKIIGYTRDEKGKVVKRTLKDEAGTIHASSGGGGNTDQFVMIGALSGRNPENPSDRTTGSPTEQRLEINENGTSNALTTVQKDNLVVYNIKRLNETLDKHDLPEGEVRFVDSYNQSVHENASTITSRINATSDRHLWDGYKIRRLTPIECFRLMDFPDEIVHKAREAGMSDSQLYKQAGNSIVVRVLEKIFDKMPF